VVTAEDVPAAIGLVLPARSVVEEGFTVSATDCAVLHPVTATVYGEIAGEVGAVTELTLQPAPVTLKSAAVSEPAVRASLVATLKFRVAALEGVAGPVTVNDAGVRSMVTLFEKLNQVLRLLVSTAAASASLIPRAPSEQPVTLMVYEEPLPVRALGAAQPVAAVTAVSIEKSLAVNPVTSRGNVTLKVMSLELVKSLAVMFA
jgi:hypothetical protein